jgi:hypothetical protein
VKHISDAAEALGLPLRITLVRGTDEQELTSVIGRLDSASAARIRVYDLQPVGRARTLPLTLHRREIEGFCTACSSPALADDGRLMACNGPAYFEPRGSPLVVGSVRDTSLSELIDRHRTDPILDAIRTVGPSGLRDELREMPGFEGFPFRSTYAGICDLCQDITRSPGAVAALRDRLEQPDSAALRMARWQVIAGSRRRGVLSPAYVNGVGAARLFLAAAWDRRLGADAEHVLGRADFDWRRSLTYLSGCGLARPLAAVLDDPGMRRWTPQFYSDELRARGVADSVRSLVWHDVVRQIAEALDDLGGRGVILKGGALQLLARPDRPARATSDVDVLVDEVLAVPLRRALLARGFDGDAAGDRSALQHLAPVFFHGVPIEVHTRVMAPFWRLPEQEMLADLRPVPESGTLVTLSPEAMLYHASTHASATFFSFGLKTAWDVLAILQTATPFDWDRLKNWAERSDTARAFWTPLKVLTEALGLPVPASFLRHAPRDPGARRIALVAQHRLFNATEGMFDLDALTKAGMMLLLQDGWTGKARYLSAKLAWRGQRPETWRDAASRARRADVLRQAWRQYQRYRRAVARGVPAMSDAE